MRVIPGSTHAAALLAATTILGISLGPQGCWFWSGDAGEMVMRQQLKLVGLAALLGITVDPAIAQEKLKIGVIVTLSGPAAALGQQVRDGFALGIKDLGGKMAGRDVELIAVDHELKPDVLVTKVKGLVERDHHVLVSGPVFSNVLLAIHKPVTDNKTLLIS